MVFFTCNNCGESIKKPAVAKHYMQKCRGVPKNVSCMDCQKDFHGEEYDAHTRCISEEEKYSGKDYVPKENKNAGQRKQDSWMEIVRDILASKDYNLSNSVRGAFQKLQNYDNVPRKQTKFQNFVKNCLRMSPKDASDVWNILSQELEKMKQANMKANQAKSAENGKKEEENGHTEEKIVEETTEKKKTKKTKEEVPEPEEPSKKKKSKKRSAEEENAPEEVPQSKKSKEEVPEPEESLKFDWSGTILKLVNKKEEIALEKLKNKVVKKYLTHSNIEVSSEKQERKINKTFTKYLKKCNLNITDDIVKLVQ